MSEGRRAASDEIAWMAHRRARSQAVWARMKTIFSFVLLAVFAGFAYGMWEEVEAAPDKYATREPDRDVTSLQHWSAKAGNLIARLQGGRATPGAPHGTIAQVEDGQPRLSPEPANEDPAELTKEELDARLRKLGVPPEDTGQKVPDIVNWEPKSPEPAKVKPKPAPADKAQPRPKWKWRQPVRPLPRNPKTLRPGMDARTAEVLEKARKARKTAMKHYEKARPEAPPNGRDAATKLTLKYLNTAQKYYGLALKGKMSSYDRRQVTAEITNVQRHMYWCHKFLSAGRGR